MGGADEGMNREWLSEEERVRGLVAAMIHRAVWDWKAVARRGLSPDATHRTLRAIDHGMQPRDARSLIEFFNSRAVECLLNAMHFPADLATIRRKLGVPEMGAGHS